MCRGDSECSNADRRLALPSGRPGGTAGLPVNVTNDFTCAAQSHQHRHAIRDEDLHSLRQISLVGAPCPHHDDTAQVIPAPDVNGTIHPCPYGGGLPLPRLLPPVRRSDLFCAVTPMDDRGRLADRSPIRAADWAPGQPVTISVTHDHRLLIVRAGGPEAITRHGHLRLPARIRHALGLAAGDRLLVTITATPRLAASVAETLTLGPSFTDDYRRYGPLQKRRHGSDQPLLSGTAGHRGDRTSAQRVAAVCRS
jgi:bifunctional DNA-binding transcriptional regulator/antitoxin component of YhaV-PrlF toxin-antitoxin module